MPGGSAFAVADAPKSRDPYSTQNVGTIGVFHSSIGRKRPISSLGMTNIYVNIDWRIADWIRCKQMGKVCVRAGVVAGMVLACCAWASALDPSFAISQYAHTTWRTQDVAEDFRGPFTQTADGYFWFGTATGLVRFDGEKFVPYAPPDLKLPSRGYRYLLGARDGSLWIGTTSGLGRLKDGKFQWYSDPAKHNGTAKIFEDKQGTIWVTRYHVRSGEGPLCSVEGTGLQCYGKNDGIPARYALGLKEDSAGYLWFGSNGLYRWRPGSPATAYLNELADRQDAGEGVNDVAIGESGTVWAAIDGVGAGLGVRYLSGGSGHRMSFLDSTEAKSMPRCCTSIRTAYCG